MTTSSRPPKSPRSSLGASSLLERVELVTFDCFGTLVDWREALPALGVDPERMPLFLRESERRQRPSHRDAQFLSYRALLAEVGGVLRPDLEVDEIDRWARRFGELPFFEDVPAAIQILGRVVSIGVVSNCDAVHQLDVARRLGRPWDVCVVAEELEAYKPTDRAWDRAVAQIGARGYDRDRWLHVSAWNDYDLAPAAARGVRTAWIPREGGVAPPAGSFDVAFDDVLSLARAVADAKGGPIAYEVDAEAVDLETMDRFVEWMRTEHLADVRACEGVRSAELLRLDGLHARAAYRFSTRAAYERYLERDAPRLRARGRELFAESELELSRTEALVLHAV